MIMVSTFSLVSMVITLLLCISIPVAALWALSRRHEKVLRAFTVGALAFVVSQMLLRIPLMALATKLAPDTVGAFLTSVPVASFSAGLFEETARLIFMILLLKGYCRRADGISFGLGHGGIEAILLVGMTMVNNIVLAILINTGQWGLIAQTMPPEVAQEVNNVLTQTPATDFLAGGVERIWAIGLHIACSLIIMIGIVRGRRFLAWFCAVIVHGLTNLSAVSALQSGVNTWAVELFGIAIIAALLWLVMRLARRELNASQPAQTL